MITPYRGTLSQYFNETEKQEFKANPDKLVNWVKQNISIKNELNVRQIPMFPTGVLKAKAADSHSRDIFFVAMARSLDIAAQIDPVTGQVQYYDTEWHNVNFEAAESTDNAKVSSTSATASATAYKTRNITPISASRNSTATVSTFSPTMPKTPALTTA